MITTMAAMLGGVPLAIGMGTGSELRRPLGITIMGGLIFRQLLTLYTTPVIYLDLDRFRSGPRECYGGAAVNVLLRTLRNLFKFRGCFVSARRVSLVRRSDCCRHAKRDLWSMTKWCDGGGSVCPTPARGPG